MRFTFTEDDLLKGTLIQPNWYDVEIVATEDKTASTGVGGTCVTVRVLNEGKFKGVPVDNNFWENAPGFAKNFFEALGAKVAAGVAIDLEESKVKGKKLQAYIKNEVTNKGNNRNVIADWRPARQAG